MLILLPFVAPAQNVGIGTLNPLARLHVIDSNVIFSAPQILVAPTSFSLPINGPGTRFMWIPTKGAIRGGFVANSNWDADSIGLFSAAFGANTLALGSSSFAMGTGTRAYGGDAVALGNATRAFGNYAIALGENTTANGNRSSSMGRFTIANGEASLAAGIFTNANGNYSTSLGSNTHANSFSSLAIGQFNDTTASGSKTAWAGKDPLLYIGNGSGATRHNTLTIYKNGNIISKNPTTLLSSNTPYDLAVTGSGTRMMWIPEKSAFFVGTVTGGFWDNIAPWTFSAGYDARATGNSAVAFGLGTEAQGVAAFAACSDTKAFGNTSSSFGDGTIANAYGSVAMGRYNDYIVGSSQNSWIASDPLLMLGNGTSNLVRSNALIVYKNGNTDISGYTQLGTTSEAAPSIKMKKLTGNSANSQGGLVAIPHGLNRAKILGVQVLLTYAAAVADIPGPYLDAAGYEYNWQVTVSDINIYNKTGNIINILSKPVRILITYEE